MATRWGELSVAERRKVGVLIVKDNQIISDGFNGTPKGFPNECEDFNGKTRRLVLHAESNAISKLAKSPHSSLESTMYTSLSPCYECSKLIIQSGITRVVCGERYRDLSGLFFLRSAGVEVEFINE